MTTCHHIDVDAHGTCYACGQYVRESDAAPAIAALMPEVYEAVTGRPAWMDADPDHLMTQALTPLTRGRPEPERLEGAALRSIRHVLGMSGADLADALDVRADTLRRWESGREPVPYRIPAELIPVTEQRLSEITDLLTRLHAATT